MINNKLVNKKIFILAFTIAFFLMVICLFLFVTSSSMQEAINNNYLYSINDVKTLKEKIKTASGIKNDGDIYYYNGTDVNNNIIFADICWQIVRTTENGGVKLIYNGVPVNGKCTSSVNYIDSSTYNSEANKITSVGYMYGDYDYGKVQFFNDTAATNIFNSSEGSTSFIYGTAATWNSTTGTYTLQQAKVYNSSNFMIDYNMGLKWKYTCFVTGDYNVYNGEDTDVFECGDVVYLASGGMSNASYVSLPSGYSYDSDDYLYLLKGFENANVTNQGSATWAFSNGASLDSGKYVLDSDSMTEFNMFQWETADKTTIDDYHYTCFRRSEYNDENVSCDKLYYVFYLGEAGLYYFEIDPSDGVDLSLLESEAYLNSLLENNDNSSTIKSNVDNWFSNTFTTSNEATQYLKDSNYCNDRSIDDSGGWFLNNSITESIIFSAANRNLFSLSCSEKNTLTAKVGLLSYDEALMAGVTSSSNSYLGLNSFWLMTPYSYKEEVVNTIETVNYYDMVSKVYIVGNSGISNSIVDSTNNVRPVISISDDLKVIGTGTPDDPITLSFAVKYELGSDDVTGVDVPETDYYASGDSVILDTSFVVGNVYNGYVFKGWITSDVTISDGKFTMPEQDVTLTGSWTKVEYITPVIDVSVRYSSNIRIGRNAHFNVSVTNDEDYEITDVYIETSAGSRLYCSYDSDFSCTRVNDTTLKIASIPAHQTFSTSRVYVDAIKIGKVELEAKITSASAESAIFDTSKEYKDSDYATTTAGVKICNKLDGEGDGSVYQYYIEKTIKSKMIPVYDEVGDDVESVIIGYWVVLEPNTCTSIALDTSTSSTEVIYTIFQLDKQENTLVKVDGLINSNGGEFSLEPKEYTVTFYNKYVKKKYFHGWDRIENDIEGKTLPI